MGTQPEEQASPSLRTECHASPILPARAWQVLRWTPDLQDCSQISDLLTDHLPHVFDLVGSFHILSPVSPGSLTLLILHTRFQAEMFQNLGTWICVQRFHELCRKNKLSGEAQIGPVHPRTCPDCLRPEEENISPFSLWWSTISPFSASEAGHHKEKLLHAMRCRNYETILSYPKYLHQHDSDDLWLHIAFIPIVADALWNFHSEISIDEITAGLSFDHLTRRPREAINLWLSSLPAIIRKWSDKENACAIRSICNTILEQPSLPGTQASLAHLLGLSPAYFCQLFQEQVGQNFSSFVISARISYAKRLLLQGGYSLKEIAQQCGYSDPSHFCKLFRKHAGMTPKQFAEHARNKN